MTGNYPDIPAPRMPYDRDGTQGYDITSGNVATQISSVNMAKWNDELAGTISEIQQNWLLMFPTLVDIVGIYYQSIANSGGVGPSLVMQTSVNTTNGVDGTWTTVSAVAPASTTSFNPTYRTDIRTVSWLGIKALKITIPSGTSDLRKVHLYGTPSAGQNPNRLEFWHPTLDQSLGLTPAYLDWGDVPRGTTTVKQVRVKNLSTGLTANSVAVGVEALTDASPTVIGQTSLSADGVTYSSGLTLASPLAPGAISPVLSIKQVTTTSTVLGLWTQRFYARAGAWS